jgi:hypothetical protein
MASPTHPFLVHADSGTQPEHETAMVMDVMHLRPLAFKGHQTTCINIGVVVQCLTLMDREGGSYVPVRLLLGEPEGYAG